MVSSSTKPGPSLLDKSPLATIMDRTVTSSAKEETASLLNLYNEDTEVKMTHACCMTHSHNISTANLCTFISIQVWTLATQSSCVSLTFTEQVTAPSHMILILTEGNIVQL